MAAFDRVFEQKAEATPFRVVAGYVRIRDDATV